MKISPLAQQVLAVCVAASVAACSGVGSTLQTGTAQKPAAQVAHGTSSFVHAGVPFAPRSAHPASVSHTIMASYPTTAQLLFEGDQANNQVAIYKAARLAHNPAPIATISLTCPYGLAMNAAGTLFVASNCGGNTVTEYPIGSTSPSVTITNGISNPLGLAIDGSGRLYVSNYPAAITEYTAGSTSPSVTITGGGLADPFGLALDSSKNLYVADFGADQVFEIKRHTTTPIPLNLQGLAEPIGVAFDNLGNLWVTDGSGDKVLVYPPGSTVASQTITSGYSFPYAITIDKHGKVAISNISAPIAVYAYLPGQFTPFATLTNGVTLPTGLLLKLP